MLARDIGGIRTILAEFDPFEDWPKSRRPEFRVEDDLCTALFLLYANHEGKETKAFLKRTIKVADRALNENKCESKLSKGSFPANRGRVLRARAYARSLQGARLDIKALEQASRDFEVYCQDIGAENWDEISQPIFLAAIRLALICGDTGRAQNLLASRRCTGKLKKEQAMWQAVVNTLRECGLPINDEALFAKFESVFDRSRNPYETEEITSLEMGLLRDRYFGSDGSEICWKRIIASISR